MRRFPVATLPAVGQSIDLDDTSAHHFRRVLRGRPGQHIELFDGDRGVATAEVVHMDDDRIEVRVLAVQVIDSSDDCILALAVLKGPAMDTAVRMATEAGATAIWTVLAHRSVATGDRSDRWSRVVVSAAKQCGRVSIPDVRAPRPLADVLEDLKEHRVVIAHPTATEAPATSGPRAVLVGPEGGWTDAEVKQVLASGARAVSLGPYVLRADTAAAVGVALLQRT